jgi:Tfp pilus assembly protein PilF
VSLIADSLKRAVKEKSVPRRDSSQEINLVGKRNPGKHPGLWSVFRIGLLIVLPTAILVYLIGSGAFDINKPQVTPTPVAQVVPPPEEAKAPPSSSVPPESPDEKTVTPPTPATKPVEKETPALEKKVATPDAPPAPGKRDAVTKKAPSYPPKKQVAKESIRVVEVPKETVVQLPTPVSKPEIIIASRTLPKVSEKTVVKVAPTQAVTAGASEEAVVLEKTAVVLNSRAPVPETPPAVKPVEDTIPQTEMAKTPETPVKPVDQPLREVTKALPSPRTPDKMVAVENKETLRDSTAKVQKNAIVSMPVSGSKPEITRTDPDRSENVFQNSDFYFNRAVFFQQAKDWQKALDNYVKAEQLDPNNPDTYNNKGVIFKELGQYDRAIDEFLRAVFLNPQYAKAYNNIGVVYFMQKNYAEAIRNYLKAIDLNASNLEAFNNLAIIYKKQKDLEKAQAVLNQALSMDPDHPGTNYNLAVLYEENKEITPALHYYRRFIELGTINYPALVSQVKKHLEILKPQ